MQATKVRKIRDRGETKERQSNARVFSRNPDTHEGRNAEVLKASDRYATSIVSDPFDYDGTTSGDKALEVLSPPYNPASLARLPPQNNMLLQCINALVTNIHLTGHTLAPRVSEDNKAAAKDSEEAKTEKRRIESLLECPDGKHTFKQIRRVIGTDFETCGYWFLEVGRNGKGEVAWFAPLPVTEVRLCKLDPEVIEVTRYLARDGEYIPVKMDVQFRRAVQQKGSKKKYFKEFGDPRNIDPKTGKVNDKLGVMESATEFIYFGRYFPGHDYGLPRWVNQIPGILGSREMEIVNLNFFYDNAIPAMAVLVAGGSLTNQSADAIDDMVTGVKGRESIHRVLVLEALPPDDAGTIDGEPPVPKISMEPLNGRQNDAMFVEYDRENRIKIRSSCQLPALFVGLAEDHSFAAANSAMQVAENQVFAPDRGDFDDIMNMTVLSYDGRPPLHWRLRSNMARMSDPTSVMAGLETLNSMGAATPNLGIKMANEMYGLTLSSIEEEWGDWPFALIMEMAKAGLFQSAGAEAALSQIDTAISKFKGTPPVKGGAKALSDKQNSGKAPPAKPATAPKPSAKPTPSPKPVTKRVIRDR